MRRPGLFWGAGHTACGAGPSLLFWPRGRRRSGMIFSSGHSKWDAPRRLLQLRNRRRKISNHRLGGKPNFLSEDIFRSDAVWSRAGRFLHLELLKSVGLSRVTTGDRWGGGVTGISLLCGSQLGPQDVSILTGASLLVGPRTRTLGDALHGHRRDWRRRGVPAVNSHSLAWCGSLASYPLLRNSLFITRCRSTYWSPDNLAFFFFSIIHEI